jgi:hypothetical protein
MTEAEHSRLHNSQLWESEKSQRYGGVRCFCFPSLTMFKFLPLLPKVQLTHVSNTDVLKKRCRAAHGENNCCLRVCRRFRHDPCYRWQEYTSTSSNVLLWRHVSSTYYRRCPGSGPLSRGLNRLFNANPSARLPTRHVINSFHFNMAARVIIIQLSERLRIFRLLKIFTAA